MTQSVVPHSLVLRPLAPPRALPRLVSPPHHNDDQSDAPCSVVPHPMASARAFAQKPTAVGKVRNGVSKTGKYSTKRRKLLYFSAFLIVLFRKNPLNSRGGKIPRVFSPFCGSVVILRFSGGERILLRAFRPPLLAGRERVFRALLLLCCFFCSFFSYPPRSSPNRLALAKAKPRMPRGFAPFF